MRFYPDLVVATAVSDATRMYLGWFKEDHKDAKDPSIEDARKIMGNIMISPKTCAVKQEDILGNDLANVFFGYEGGKWSINDYQEYLKGMNDMFEETGDQFGRYRLRIDNFRNNRDIKVDEFIKKTCRKMLTQGVYSTSILRKFGLA